MAIEWIDVESSNIGAIAYIPQAEQLMVQFTNGSVYAYSNVSAEVFEEFLDADSKGKYLNTHIKGVYDYERVST